MNVFWASPLTLYASEYITIDAILQTSPASWLMQKADDKELPFVTNPFLIPASGAQSKHKAQYTVAAALDGALNGYYSTLSTQSAKIFVISDQYVVSNAMLEYTSAMQNLDFFINAVIWLDGENNLLNLKQRVNNMTLYKVDDSALVSSTIPVILLTGLFIPLVIPVCGVWFRLRRKVR
jgi:ABC-type uncharacterized transport system involved in gliding motility auxiliary subunit